MINKLLLYAVIVLALALLVPGCEKENKEEKPEFTLKEPDQIPEEEYNIYALVIDERYSSEKIVIAQHTTTRFDLTYQAPFYDLLLDSFPDFDTSLVQIHKELNEEAINFGNAFKSETKQITVISSEELSYIFDSHDVEKDWDEFFNDYEGSNGVIRFTRIAFNEDKTQSIFEMGRQYAGLGGFGSIVYLTKQEDGWIIEKIIITWIS